MKRLLIFVLIWVLAMPAMAQEAAVWGSACSAAAADVIAPIMGADLYAAGCEALQMCSVESAPIGCEFPVYEALLALCAGDDCALQSSFYMASLLIFEDPGISGYIYAPDAVQAVIADALLAFQAGDYQQVLAIFESVSGGFYSGWDTETDISPFIGFIIGLMHEQLGDLDAALAAYRASIDLLRLPLVTAQRANVLIQLGHPDAAAAEALIMGAYPAAEALLAEYPLPDELLENWTLYLDELNWRGEYGPSTRDYSAMPPLPLQVAFLSDGSLLVLGAAEIARVPYEEYIPPDVLLFYPAGEGYLYANYWSGFTVTLSFDGQVGFVLQHQVYVTGDTYFDMLITPAGTPDPREGQDQRCAGGARWRLLVDGYGAAASVYGEGTPYYDQPGGAVVGRFNVDLQTFRVVSGPVCLGSQAWWEVDLGQDDGLTYWLPEAEAQNPAVPRGLEYLVFPIDAPGD